MDSCAVTIVSYSGTQPLSEKEILIIIISRYLHSIARSIPGLLSTLNGVRVSHSSFTIIMPLRLKGTAPKTALTVATPLSGKFYDFRPIRLPIYTQFT